MILAALALDAAATWIPVGVSGSGLRVFVERASVREVGGLRRARVRIGATYAFAGAIDLVYQDEEFDCRAHTWRLLGYEARDAADRVIRRSGAEEPPHPALPAEPGSLGGEVTATVCAVSL